jgi:hypothetical protein
MKKFFGIFLAAMLMVGAAGQAMAAFSSGDLIRVVYSTGTSTEYATSLGNVNTVLSSANGTVLGGGADAFSLAKLGASSFNQLYVAYYVWGGSSTAAGTKHYVGATSAPTPDTTTSWTFFRASGSLVNGYYLDIANFIPGTNSATGPNSDLYPNSYYQKMDGKGTKTGLYAGWFNSALGNPGTTLQLAASGPTLAEQALYVFTKSSTSANDALPLVATGVSLRTLANGTTEVSAVPIPPSILLLGSGLLGMIGIRRKLA